MQSIPTDFFVCVCVKNAQMDVGQKNKQKKKAPFGFLKNQLQMLEMNLVGYYVVRT